MSRAWPMVSAKTVAQNPAGSVIPPLSAAHAVVLATCVLLAEVESVEPVPSVLAHAQSVSAIVTAVNFIFTVGWERGAR